MADAAVLHAALALLFSFFGTPPVWLCRGLAVIPRVLRAPNSNSLRSSKGRKGV